MIDLSWLKALVAKLAPKPKPKPKPKPAPLSQTFDWADDDRFVNYNNPINYLADTMEQHNRFPPLTFAQWEAKKAAWKAAGTFDAMYASTDPTIARRVCAPFCGKFAGQPYEVIEAEVRSLCMADKGSVRF